MSCLLEHTDKNLKIFQKYPEQSWSNIKNETDSIILKNFWSNLCLDSLMVFFIFEIYSVLKLIQKTKVGKYSCPECCNLISDTRNFVYSHRTTYINVRWLMFPGQHDFSLNNQRSSFFLSHGTLNPISPTKIIFVSLKDDTGF